jgi:spore germination cell wall hydrolase CwlJ-like protein
MMNTSDPVDVLARVVWGEARSTGAPGMRHVASVIMNRAAHPGWWGTDVVSVCLAPWQFSCLNEGDPNRPKLEAVTEADGWFAIAKSIATQAIAGQLSDETFGADSYFALTMPTKPRWTTSAQHTFSDGWHSFWITHATSVQNVSVHSVADDLNDAELAKIKGTEA